MDIFGNSQRHYKGYTDNDIGRLQLGREISRPRKKADIKKDMYKRAPVRKGLAMELKLRGNFFEPSAIRFATLKQTLQRILKKRVRNPTILN